MGITLNDNNWILRGRIVEKYVTSVMICCDHYNYYKCKGLRLFLIEANLKLSPPAQIGMKNHNSKY